MNVPITVLAFGMPGGIELVVVLVVALLIFGRRLPGIMRSLGGSMREFKKGVNEGLDEDEAVAKESPVPGTASREKTSVTESGDEDDAPKRENEDQQRSL